MATAAPTIPAGAAGAHIAIEPTPLDVRRQPHARSAR